ncbi:MAG: B12-binding domain-containing radical SAM protein [Deltaproteobacteria bacterium]|nr:B12-binding domain-containing radical SAM protein [Deltaproteobacteria bacterium]
MGPLPRMRLVQLPVPPPAALAATGNVPLAAGALGVSARVHGLTSRLELEVIEPSLTDVMGDALLADRVARDEPAFVGLSLYLWNVERSLHLAREIKKRSPKTKILIGGPEVSSDNPFVLQAKGYDLAVAGEAEDTFAKLMHALLDGGDGAGLPGVAVRKPLGLSAFGATPQANFPLTAYPSPYLEGLVPVEPQRSTYVETVRGCRSHCTFCFYPRSSSVLRVLEPDPSAQLVQKLKDKGAREVVFLDPTFNHRPEFEPLLDALAEVNSDRALTFFAEVRAEGLKAHHAKKLAQAGFTRLEIGLQSVNPETLKRVKRGGSAKLVAEAAKLLHGEGIELLVDLIIGLPGDAPDDVKRGVEFLQEHGLGGEAQVFPLSLLPGTAMRATAEEDGVVFDPSPPYRVQRTATFTQEQLLRALEDTEDVLERRVDEVPRPHLVASARAQGPCDVFAIDLDGASEADFVKLAQPGAQHAALWISGRDLFGQRDRALRAIDARLGTDPHATFDVVLRASEPFPMDLLDRVRERLRGAAPSWQMRQLSHRGEDAMRRVTVSLPEGALLPQDWLQAVMHEVPVFRDQPLSQALRDAEELGQSLPGARVIADAQASREDLASLARRADADCVTFADRALESHWTLRVLGYGDADR